MAARSRRAAAKNRPSPSACRVRPLRPDRDLSCSPPTPVSLNSTRPDHTTSVFSLQIGQLMASATHPTTNVATSERPRINPTLPTNQQPIRRVISNRLPTPGTRTSPGNRREQGHLRAEITPDSQGVRRGMVGRDSAHSAAVDALQLRPEPPAARGAPYRLRAACRR